MYKWGTNTTTSQVIRVALVRFLWIVATEMTGIIQKKRSRKPKIRSG